MRNFILHILVLLVFATAAHARDAVVVQSLNVKPYDDLYQSFRSAYPGSVSRIILPETTKDVVRQVKEERPKVVLAIGTDALMQVRKIKDVPVVYAMVLNPGGLVGDSPNMTGINMVITPERQLGTFRKILPPSARRIGVLYDPTRSAGFIKKAQAAARQSGFELVVREVPTVKDLPKALTALKGSVDALWLLPDQTVVSPETVEHILLFGMEHGLPVLSFSMKYVKMGALISLDLDPSDLGRQAADLARKAASGGDLKESVFPRSAVPHVNSRISRKLGIDIDDDLLKRIGAVRVD